MSRFVSCLLLFLFISGTLTVAFNPTTASEAIENTWHTKTPMTQERSDAVELVVVDGKIHAIGGSAFGSGGIHERYDPATDKWTILEPQPNQNARICVVAFQEKIYCFNPYTWPRVIIDIYDTTMNSWSTKTSTTDIIGPVSQAQVIDEKIFVITQEYVDVEYLRESDKTTQTIQCYIWHLYMYDPIEDSWTEKAKIPFFSPNQARDIAFVAVDDKLMAFGTFYTNPTLTLTNNNYETKILVYNPETDKWTDEGTTPITFGYIMSSFRPIVAVTSGVYAPQKIYFFSDMTSTTLVYDPADNVWSTAELMPAASNGNYATATVDDIIYVIGEEQIWISSGNARSEYVNLQYIPIGYHGTLPPTGLSLNNPLIITTIILIISIIGTCLIYFIHKKRYIKKETIKLSKNETEKTLQPQLDKN